MNPSAIIESASLKELFLLAAQNPLSWEPIHQFFSTKPTLFCGGTLPHSLMFAVSARNMIKFQLYDENVHLVGNANQRAQIMGADFYFYESKDLTQEGEVWFLSCSSPIIETACMMLLHFFHLTFPCLFGSLSIGSLTNLPIANRDYAMPEVKCLDLGAAIKSTRGILDAVAKFKCSYLKLSCELEYGAIFEERLRVHTLNVISKNNWMNRTHLFTFEFKRLLTNQYFSFVDLNDFVKRWLSGNNSRLETAIFLKPELTFPNFHLYNILTGIEIVPQIEKQAGDVIALALTPVADSVVRGVDLLRADGTRATAFTIDKLGVNHGFGFVVWPRPPTSEH